MSTVGGEANLLGTAQPDLPSVRASDYTGRSLDVVVGSAFLVLALPAALLLALLIAIESRSSPLFSHRRVGRNGVTFQCWKLRTMRPQAEGELEQLLESDPGLALEFAATRKLKRDPRVTRLGRVLRPLGLDELPQLFNVVKGEMSLVGPRPRAVAELSRCGPVPDELLQVRPGLTGPWQIAGRNDCTDQERIQMDLDYLRTKSLRRDLEILGVTLWRFATASLRGGY